MSESRFQPLQVAYVREETADARVVGFNAPFDFTPGQYLTLRAEIGGKAEQRCYSICSALGGSAIEVAIKRVPGGRFSEWAADALTAGMTVDVMAPEGRFGLAPDAGAARAYLAIAAGSGVTPVMSLAESLLESEPHARFTFVYGNRDTASIMFRERLDDLKDRYLERFSLIHVLSREAQDVDLFHGRIDADRIGRLAAAGLIDPAGADAIFLCGPGDLPETAAEALQTLGVRRERIHREAFTPTPGAAPRPRPPEAAAESIVTAIIDGGARTFPMQAGDSSAIDAGERAGVELPSSCRGGMCCTCRALVVSGEAHMAVNYSLEDWELEAGFVLACQTTPVTKTLTLDFDAV